MLFKQYILIVTLSSICFSAIGQTVFVVRNFDFGIETKCIFQDKRGILWFGTSNGLIRYDGVNKIVVYKFDSRNKHSLSNNNIWDLDDDRYGNLWIATDNGLNRYNNKTDDFDVYQKDESGKSIPGNQIICLEKDKLGNLWAGLSDKGLCMLQQTGNENEVAFKSYTHYANDSTSFPIGNAWCLSFDNENNCFTGNYLQGVVIFNPATAQNKIRYKTLTADKNQIQSNNVQFIYFDSTLNATWVLNQNGMLDLVQIAGDNLNSEQVDIMHFGDKLKNQLGLKFITPFRILSDAHNHYWLATNEQGLISFSLKKTNGKLTIDNANKLSKFEMNKDSLQSNSILSVFKDRSNHLWLGTEEAYVSHINLNQNVFQYQINPAVHSEISKLNIASVTADSENNLWLGCNGSPFIYILSDNRVRKLRIHEPHLNSELFSNITYCVNKLRNNKIVAGGDFGLVTINASKSLTGVVAKNNVELNTPSVIQRIDSGVMYFCLHETQSNGIFAGTSAGMIHYNSDFTGREQLNLINSTQTLRVREIESIRDSLLLIATDLGLLMYNHQLKEMRSFDDFSGTERNILNSHVSSVAILNNDEFIAGSNDGIYRINLKSKTISLAALRDLKIVQLMFDRASKMIFAGTLSGLYCIDSSGYIINFTTHDGLANNIFNDNSNCIMADGSIVTGTISGINRFMPKGINSSLFNIPSVLFTDFEIYKSSILDLKNNYPELRKGFLSGSTMFLSEKDNDITISFAALNYYDRGKNFYQYSFGDNSWIDNQNNTDVRLLISPKYRSWFFPGTYTFKVRARITGDQWILVHQPIKISMRPFWFKSIEFISFVVILLLSLVVYVVRYYAQVKLRQRLAEQEKELAVERERNRISRDLHDDLGSGLSSVAMMTNQIKELVTDEQAKDSAWEISNEANDLVARMREIIWSMSSKNDTLENLIVYIDKYSKNYLEKNYLQYSFWGETQFPDIIMNGDARRNIFLVVKESLHNIIKHSGATEVILQCKSENGFIKLEISDNGKGFDMANIHRFGNGLANMKQRMENAGGIYDIKSQPGKGTTTTLHICAK